MKALVALDLTDETDAPLSQAVAWGARLGAKLDLVSAAPMISVASPPSDRPTTQRSQWTGRTCSR